MKFQTFQLPAVAVALLLAGCSGVERSLNQDDDYPPPPPPSSRPRTPILPASAPVNTTPPDARATAPAAATASSSAAAPSSYNTPAPAPSNAAAPVNTAYAPTPTPTYSAPPAPASSPAPTSSYTGTSASSSYSSTPTTSAPPPAPASSPAPAATSASSALALALAPAPTASAYSASTAAPSPAATTASSVSAPATAASAGPSFKIYDPAAAGATTTLAAEKPGVEFRILHREFVPAATTPLHTVVVLKEASGATAEYEVLRRPGVNGGYYAKVTPEATEAIIASVHAQTDGLNAWNNYVLSPEGVKKFEEIIARIAADNNASGNGNGCVVIVLDGVPAITVALAQNPQTKKWDAATVAPVFEIPAASYSQATARETAFNLRNRK
jgi:hypothetical protein